MIDSDFHYIISYRFCQEHCFFQVKQKIALVKDVSPRKGKDEAKLIGERCPSKNTQLLSHKTSENVRAESFLGGNDAYSAC